MFFLKLLSFFIPISSWNMSVTEKETNSETVSTRNTFYSVDNILAHLKTTNCQEGEINLELFENLAQKLSQNSLSKVRNVFTSISII